MTPNHDGSPSRSNDDFFTGAPKEIGELLSASASGTTDGLLKHERRVPMDHRYSFAAILAAFVGAIFGLFLWLGLMTAFGYDYDRHPAPALLSSPVPSMVPAAVAVFFVTLALLQRFRPSVVTFVGADGLARAKKLPGGVRVELIKFVDVDRLSSLGKELGRDDGLEHPGMFSLGWLGRQRFVIHGRWLWGKTPEDHPVHFARAALKAWQAWNERRGYGVLSSDRASAAERSPGVF